MTKILVVDDEIDIVDLLVDDLSDNGFNVISAHNGIEALEQVYREQPDVVLLDLMMPVLNGYEVLQELRRNPTTKDLPVIMLTALSPTEGEQAALRLGANHYVTKVWEPGTLQAVIRVALREAGKSQSQSQSPSKPSASRFRNVTVFHVNDQNPSARWVQEA
ncbi:MAG: response regulator [Chloroflexi bacterium]|nr:response regulator [Chloroflexota bacterium]